MPSRLPFSLKILLENLLRHEDGVTVTAEDIQGLVSWDPKAEPDREIAFRPSRVLLQDFTGVPAIVDLAAMRDAMKRLGGDPKKINPLQPVELVIDHSVQVDEAGTPQAFTANADLEFQRNRERYAFLRWGQNAFDNFRVVPPDTGIVHQVNLEYLARVVFDVQEGGTRTAYPDTLVGTDSHTTMINGLGVLGWGVGGIEAEAAMLGQAVSMLVPQVVGFKLTGTLREGATATDLVLTVTQMLRKKGVVGKFVEYYGDGLAGLPLADRATIANMAPEYGATCGLFPIDAETLRYLELSGRPARQIRLVEAYAKAQGMFHTSGAAEAEYSDTLELDLSTVEPSLAGPRRPQDRVPLHAAKASFAAALKELQAAKPKAKGKPAPTAAPLPVLDRFAGEGGGTAIGHDEVDGHNGAAAEAARSVTNGSVVIAAITSCTNTSNPSVMVAAGLLAKKAVEHGLKTKPWVKASLAPGSKVVTDYLHDAGLDTYLDQLRFNLVGYGCTTCIGNSGPLPPAISEAINEDDLVAVAVLSGNRNFEGRINSDVRANYLASPPLVVAYALAGTMDVDLQNDPLGSDPQGRPVFLKDIWPSQHEIQHAVQKSVRSEMFRTKYAEVFGGDERWSTLPVPEGDLYQWDESSTYVKNPPYFSGYGGRAGTSCADRECPGPGHAGRQYHHRPYLAGRLDQAGQPRGAILDRAGSGRGRLQFLRVPARERRGDGPRDVRQHPAAEPPRPGDGGGMDPPPSRRRTDDHLRRLPALPGRGGSARGPGGQGVRLGLVARLGRQGSTAPGHPRRDRRELRANPSVQPGGHGRPPAPVPPRRDRREPGTDRGRTLRDRGTARSDLRPVRGRPRIDRDRPAATVSRRSDFGGCSDRHPARDPLL